MTKRHAPVNRFATFLVILLLVMLPVSVSAQLSSISNSENSGEVPETVPEEQPGEHSSQLDYSYLSESDADAQVICWPWDKNCNNQCWSNCNSGNTFYCSSSGGVCCSNSAKFCDSSAGKCWTNCPAGQVWNCGSSGAYCTTQCTDNDGDGYGSGCSKGSDCNDNNANINPGKSETCNGVDDDCDGSVDEGVKNACGGCGAVPSEKCGDNIDNDCDGQTDEGCCAGNRECGGQCWSACSSGETWNCGSWGGAYCCGPADKFCGKSCWKPCPSGQTWNCGSDGTAYCTTPCVDNDGDGYGSGCSKGSDCNDNDASVNPGKSEVCGDGKDNNCNGQVDEGCCSNPDPYYCEKTGSCWKKPQCDSSIKCGGQWWACNEPSKYNVKCVDSKPGCCLPEHPYFCPANNFCFPADGFCDGRKVENCNGKYQVCNKKTDVGKCFGDTLRCCPPGEAWWESDKQCHKSSEPQKCSVPDGTSANCDCDSDSDCPSSSGKPYCGEGGTLYNVRTAQGFNACLSSKPEYCGNGKCAGNETYNNCASDCGSLAPKGTINVDVYYSSGASANKPISGAYVYLDGVPKGTTGIDGKLGFETGYGSRTVKVECPDKAFCAEKTVGVDGAKYASFSCACATAAQQFGELQIRVRTLHSEKDEGYPIYNAYVFLDNGEKGLTDIFGNLYISKVNYGTHQLGIGLKIADKEGEEPYDHKYSFDIVVDEPFENKTANIVTAQQNILSQGPSSVESAVLTASTYNATYVPEAIPFIVVAVVTVGFVTWAFGDYSKCVEETDSWWGATGKTLWTLTSCNLIGLIIGNAIDKDHVNNCGKKWTALGKNTWEKCMPEVAFVGLSVIPGAWLVKAAGKLFVTIKGAVYAIPYVEKFLGYGIKVVKESDTVIKVVDGAKEFGYKLIGGSLQLYDNIVGMLVKVMSNAGVKKEIAEAVGEMLRATTAADFKAAGLKTLDEMVGELGERVAVKTADIAANALVKEGAVFLRPTGKAGEVFASSSNYKIVYDNKGKLQIWKNNGEGKFVHALGDFDDFYKINDRPIVTEVKTMQASLLDDLIPDKIRLFPPGIKNGIKTKLINRLNAYKEVTGETSEVMIVIPKGEAVKSKKLQGLINDIRNAGFKAEYVELEATFSEIEKVARKLSQEIAKGGG